MSEKKSLPRRPVLPFLMAGLMAGLMGSLGACQADRLSESGIRLGDETLKQFPVGEATEDWLIAVVGPPSSRTDLPDALSVLRYSTSESSSGILDWITGKSMRNTGTIYFVVRHGLITQMWADREKEHTLLGKEVEKKSGEKK